MLRNLPTAPINQQESEFPLCRQRIVQHVCFRQVDGGERGHIV
jgi:hypothetical protein